MKIKQISFILFIIVILIGGYFLLFPPQGANYINNNGVKVIDFDNQDIDVQIRDMTDVPAEYFSGGSRYSYGDCQGDGDCEQTGCSLESCSADADRVTTCEIDSNAPDKDTYSCGCIKDVCGWYLK